MTLLKKRIEKLEQTLTPPEPAEWVRVILNGISEEAGIQRWMNENNTDTPPENIIFRVIVPV